MGFLKANLGTVSCGLLNHIKMAVNVRKTKIMNYKGNLTANLQGNQVLTTKSQKDLGIIISNNLNWNENCGKRCNKGMNALYQLKRNLSQKSHWTTRLNAYAGYVVPILTYASQAWMPNKTNMEQLEREMVISPNAISPKVISPNVFGHFA